MGKLYTCFFLLITFFTGALRAQNSISGKVIDKATGEAAAGAVICFKDSKQIAVTDNLGEFALATNATNASISITHVGYEPVEAVVYSQQENIIRVLKGGYKLQDVVLTSNLNYNYLSTISKVDLNLRPVRSSQELLRTVPGLFIAQHAGGGKAEQIFLRGFDIDHGTDVQVTVDGLPVNMVSHGHGQGYADLHFLIPELVKAIDYGKGPYYTGQGNLNTAGYVAFQTKDELEKNQFQVEGGRFGHFRGLAMANLLSAKQEKQTAFIASEFMRFDGPFQSPQNFNRFNVFGKYINQISDNTKLVFQASAFSSKWDASGQIPERAIDLKTIDRFGSIDNTEGGATGRYNMSLQLNSLFKNGNQFESQLFYSRYYFQLYSNFTFFLRDSINGDQILQRDERDIIGFNSKYSIPFTIGNTHLKTIFGGTIRHDNTYDTELSYTTKRTFLENVKLGDITESNAAVYIDQRIQYNKWLINIGTRLDYLHFNYFDKLSSIQDAPQNKGILSPKFNVQYTFNKKVQVFFKAGKGFHSNDTRVVVANQGRQILPPAYGADLGFNFHPNKNLVLNATAWYLYLQQEFVYVGDEGITEPSGRSRRVGFDFSARYQFTKSLFADVNINGASAKFIDQSKGQNNIPLAPSLTSTGGLTYANKTGINGSIRYRFITDRPANDQNTVVAKGYFLTDATINYTRSKYEIGIIVENLFNATWNEAQFDTESRLRNEPQPISEIHFTPGTPFFAKLKMAIML